jgi:hypothetical protein
MKNLLKSLTLLAVIMIGLNSNLAFAEEVDTADCSAIQGLERSVESSSSDSSDDDSASTAVAE